jgi:hypothetical protein
MKHRSRAQISLLALALAVMVTTPAVAETRQSGDQRPCMEELEKFCADVKPGAGRVILCLQEHDRDLSPVCRDKVQKAVKRLEAAKSACAQDIAQFCADVTPGGGRLIKCLSPHLQELSPECRQKGGFALKPAQKTGG